MLHGRVKNTSPPYTGCFVYYGAFTRVDCEERSDGAISESGIFRRTLQLWRRIKPVRKAFRVDRA